MQHGRFQEKAVWDYQRKRAASSRVNAAFRPLWRFEVSKGLVTCSIMMIRVQLLFSDVYTCSSLLLKRPWDKLLHLKSPVFRYLYFQRNQIVHFILFQIEMRIIVFILTLFISSAVGSVNCPACFPYCGCGSGFECWCFPESRVGAGVNHAPCYPYCECPSGTVGICASAPPWVFS